MDPVLLAAQRGDSVEDVSLSLSLNATVMPALRMTKSNSLGSISYDGCDSLLSHNDIERLTQNVRSFSDALNRLKCVFTTDEGKCYRCIPRQNVPVSFCIKSPNFQTIWSTG